jgi:cytochrome c peroxidase
MRTARREGSAAALLCGAALAAGLVSAAAAPGTDEAAGRMPHPDPNTGGMAQTFNRAGHIDTGNPFFQALGSNGRSCASCHVQAEGWTITPPGVAKRFAESRGTDPLFRLVDGANSPLADVSTLDARRLAYSMLLNKGLIRVGLGIPANAQFELAAVDDPYGYASAHELSLFRRPLPTTNLNFLSTVMWDGRETLLDATSTDCTFGTTTCFATIHTDLTDQSNTATVTHAQGPAGLTPAQREAIVGFETDLFTAQVEDRKAGRLWADGAGGGPENLAQQPFYFGINDTLVGDYRSHASFSSVVMTLYDAWQSYLPDASAADPQRRDRDVAVARRQIARGEVLFNTKPIAISGVKGLNDALHIATIAGTCTTCHNAPNAGDHSVPLPLDLGLTDLARRTPDQPLYTLRNKVTGELIQTTDPGRALVTGKWADIGKFKGPVLRALAARAPYFHNGSAPDLESAVDFYNTRFGIGFTDQEKQDLVAFLKAL